MTAVSHEKPLEEEKERLVFKDSSLIKPLQLFEQSSGFAVKFRDDLDVYLGNETHERKSSKIFMTTYLGNCSKTRDPNHVTVFNARMDMFSQVGCHVGVQVTEAVKGAKSEM